MLELRASHTDVGAYLVGLWGLPNTIAEAVAYHEDPSQSRTPAFGRGEGVLVGVQVGNEGDDLGLVGGFDGDGGQAEGLQGGCTRCQAPRCSAASSINARRDDS